MDQHNPSVRMDGCEAESLRALLRDKDIPVTFGPAAAQRIGEAISRVMLKQRPWKDPDVRRGRGA